MKKFYSFKSLLLLVMDSKFLIQLVKNWRLRIVAIFIFGLMNFGVKAQAPFNTGTITLDGNAAEAAYVTGASGNSANWSVAWDNTYLYLRVNSGSANEPVIFHIDIDPQNPVDGGTNANGSLVGQTNYGITPTLPFRSDFQVYWEGSYAEYRTDNGSGGWSGITTIPTPTDRSNGTTNREIRLTWTSMGLGARPAAFNWLGFSNSTGSFIFNQVPDENPSGGSNPQSPTLNYYYTVSSTANGSSTNPFSQKSFESRSNLTLGTANTFWDFTINGGTLTNTVNHTINNQLYVVTGTLTQTGARTLTFGSSATHTPSIRCDGTINPNNGGGNDLICTFAQGTTTLSGTASDANFRLFDVNVSTGAALQGPSTGTVTLGLQFGTMTLNGTGIVNFRNGTGLVNTNIVNNGTNNYNFSNTGGTATFNNLTVSTGATFRPITSGTHNLNIGGNLVNTPGTYSTSNTGILHTRFNGTAAQAISAAQTFQNLTVANTAANVTAGGAITIASTRVLTVDASARLDMATFGLTVTGATSSISGFLRYGSATVITGHSTTTLTFTATGNYEHNVNGGTIPTATWTAGSPGATATILAVTNTVPSGLNQAFHNFTWSPAAQSARINLGIDALASFAINGTFNVNFSGAQLLVLAEIPGSVFTKSIANFNIQLGTLYFIYAVGTDGTYKGTINTSGSYSQIGGTVHLVNGTTAARIGVITFNVVGNFTHSGGTFQMTNSTIAGAAPTSTTLNLTGASSSMAISSTFNLSGNSTYSTDLPSINLTGATSSFSQTAGTINFGASASAVGVGTINLAGTYSRSGTGALTTTSTGAPNGTFTFNGGSGQTITSTSSGSTQYVNFVVANGSTTTLLSSMAINTSAQTTLPNATFTVNSGGTLNFGTSVLSGITTYSTFVALTGSTLVTGNTNATGAFMTTGANGSVQTSVRTFTNTGVNYTFNGSAAQFTGDAIAAATNIGTLNLSNTTAGPAVALTFTSSPTVATALNVNNGINQLGANNITITPTTAASVTGGSSTAFIQTNSTGRLIRAIATAGLPITYNFPVGTSTNYTPASFAFSANSTARNLIVGAVGAVHPNNGSPADYINNRYWVTNLSVSTGTYAYTSAFTYITSPTDVVGTIGNIRLSRWGGSLPWVDDNTSSASGAVLTSTTGLTQATGNLATTAEWAGRINVAPVSYTWTGATNNAWGTATNWSPNGVPGTIDNVTLNQGTAGPAFANLNLTSAVTVTNITFAGTPSFFTVGAAGAITATGNVTYTSGSGAWDCASTFTMSSSSLQTIPPFNYGNLDATGGNRTLPSSGTVGICGTFTRGAGTYTVTGSTVDYNGTGAQTISVGTYNNLTISNARGSANLTSPAGTISVAGTFDVSGLSAYTPVVNASSIFDFTSAGVQTVPAFFYGRIEHTGNGNRIWASSGTIDINQGFAPGSGIHTITGSTVRYSNTSGTTWNFSVFTTNLTSPARQYNNLIINGGAAIIWSLNGNTIGVAGNLTVTSGTLQVGSSGGPGVLNVDGNIAIDGANGILNVSASTLANTGTINLLGNFSISAGLFDKSGSANGIFDFEKTVSSPVQTISQTGGIITNNGTSWNLGTGSTPNVVEFTSNVTMSGGTVNANDQATIDFNTFLLTNGTFVANTGTTLVTSNTDATGALMTSTASGSVRSTTRTFTNAGVNYTFDGTAAQFTGNAIAAATNVGTLNLSNTSGANPALTLTSSPTVGTALNVNNGINQLEANNITISATTASSVTGGSSTAFIQTNGAGRLIRAIATAGLPINYSFPIGNSTNYTPAAFNFTANAGAMNLIVGTVGSRNSNDVTPTDYINNRYWVTGLSGTPSTYAYTSVFTFLTAPTDVVGTIGNIRLNRFGGTTWTEDASSSASGSSLSSSSLTQATGSLSATAEWAGRVNPPFATYTWDGSANNGSWDDATNWDLNAVPSSSSDVIIIPDVAPLAALAISGTRAVADFTVQTNGTFSMAASSQLTINGNYTYSSSTAATFNCSSTLILSSASAQTLPAANYGNLNLAGGARTLTSAATTRICGNYTPGSSSTVGTSIVEFNGTTAQAINTNASSFATVNITNTTAPVTANTNFTASTAMTINSTAVLNQAGGTLTLTGATVSVNGTLRNSTTNNIVGGTITVSGTGTYDHNRNSGTVPTATWSVGSTCLISGTTTAAPTSGLGQAFSDFTWNTPNMSSGDNLSGALTNVGRDLRIVSTGSTPQNLGLVATTAYTGTIGRDLLISGGNLILVTGANNNNISLGVTRNLELSNAASFIVSSGSGTGTAALTVTGTFTNTSSNTSSFIVNSGTKTVAVSATVTGAYLQNGSGTSSINTNSTATTVSLVANGGYTISSGIQNVANGGAGTLTVGTATTLTVNGGTLIGSATAHTSTINANGNVAVSSGILTISNFAGATSTMNLADNRNMIISGTGVVNMAPLGTGTLNIATNTPSVTATTGYLEVNGGTLNVASGGTGTLNMYQDLLLTSGTFARTGGGATVNFRAVGTAVTTPHPQTITQGTCVPSGSITYLVGLTGPSFTRLILGSNVNLGTGSTITSSSGSYLDFSTNFLSGFDFTANNGTNLVSANADGFNTIATGAIGSLRTTNSRNLTATQIQYIFNGTVAQVTGTSVSTALYVTIGNPNPVTLSTNLAIASTGSVLVNFAGLNGILALSNFNLTFNTGIPAFGSDVVGASTSYYIRTNGTGRMISPVSTAPKQFPVGNSAYNPITLSPSVGTNIPYQVRVIDAVTSPTPNDGTKLINRYWSITAPTAAANTLTLVGQWNTGDQNANYNAGTQVKVAYHNGTAWTEINSTQVGANPFTSSGAFALSAANINSGITFSIGKDNGYIGTFTWNGSASNVWTNQNNWTPVSAVGGPIATDNVVINVPGTNTLDITSAITINNFDLSGTGTYTMSAAGSLTINGDLTYSSSATPTLDCNSTINIANSTSQPIPAFNYGNLNATGGDRILANSGIIGICGTFTRDAGAYTVTGSTVNYNGSGAQTIAVGTYNNLSISNARGSANLTSPSGTISVAGTFDVSSLSAYTPVVNAASIFDFTGAGSQSIPAFFYGQLNNTGNGARTWASSGIIDINQNFSPGSGSHTVTSSSVRYSNTAANTFSLASFTSSATPRHYNNLEIVGGATTNYNLASGFNMGCAGNFVYSGAGTFTVALNATANTMTVNGTATLNGTGTVLIANTATAALVNAFNVTGNTTISSGLLNNVGATSGTTVQGNFTTNDLTISGTGAVNMDAASNSAVGTLTVNGNLSVTSTTANAINFGSGTANGGNVFNLKGNLTKSGTGTFGCTGTFSSTSGFLLNNGSGVQTISYTGTAMTASNFTASAGSTLQLSGNLTLGSAGASSLNTAGSGILDFGTNVVTAGNAANLFSLSSTGTFRTANTAGVGGSLSGFTVGNCSFASGATFEFNGASAQNTGVTTFTGISTSNQYTITWLGTTSLTLDKSWDLAAFNFTNSGLIIMGNFDISLTSGASALTGSGFGIGKMFLTNGTGTLSRAVLSSGTGLPFTWPIGENTGTTEYSPVTVGSITGSAINGSIRFRVIDGIQPNNSPAISYITRYWPCTVIGFTNPGYSLGVSTFTYDPSDIVVGPEASLRGNSYSSTIADWTQFASSSCASNVLTITSGPNGSNMPSGTNIAPLTYDITARIDVPVYYRTISSGAWQTAANWEVSSDPAFISPAPSTPGLPPNNINSEGITIRNTHAITSSASFTADDLTIESGGTLEITNNSFTLANGTASPDMIINSGGLFRMASSSNNALIVSSGATMQVNGTMQQAGSASPDVTNSGGTITIGASGTYDHARNAGIIPTCNWTAGSPGATCLLSAITNNVPTGLSQSFYNFTVNSTITASVNCSGNLQTILGDFNVTTNHASFGFRLSTGTSFTLNVSGNLNVTNGILDIASAGSGPCTVNIAGTTTMTGAGSQIIKSGASTVTWNFNGDFTQNSGTFEFNSGGSSNTTVSFKGNVVLNGTINRTNGGTHIINFDKASGLQTLNSAATFGAGAVSWNIGNGTGGSNTVRLLSNLALNNSTQTFTVNNGDVFDCGAFVLTGGNTSFVLNATGGLKSGNANGIYIAPTALGSVQTLNRTYPGTASYYYNGTINQFTGNALPNTLTTTGNINIENTGTAGNNTVTLTSNNTTTPTINLISGLFAADTPQQLNITSGGTVNASGGDFATGATAGLLNFPGTGTFTGSCSPYNVHIAGGVNFGAGTVTIQNGGRLRILAGGSAITYAPAYAVGSTLEYNTGGNYDRGLEWSTAAGKGFPHHVVVSANTNMVPARTDNTYANVPFQCAGNLTINSGSSIYMDNNFGANNMTEDLRILGNLNLTGAFSLSRTTGSDLFIGGNWTNNGTGTNAFLTSPNDREVVFNGSGAQSIQGSNTTIPAFAFMAITKSSGDVTLNFSTPSSLLNINNRLELNTGNLILGSHNLRLSSSAPITNASASSFVITNGAGYLQKVFTGNGAFTWPVGDNTGTVEYSPATLNVTSSGGTLGMRVINATHPSMGTSVHYINRYWNTSMSAATYSWNGTFNYTNADIVGTQTNMLLNIYDPNAPNIGWTEYPSSSAAANVLTVTTGPSTGSLNNTDITGRKDVPLYYRSIASGDWSDVTKWESSTDPAFSIPPPTTPVVVAPTNMNSLGIQIRNTHTITATTTIAADDLDVQTGGTLTIGAGANFTVTNGFAATDFTINGTFNVNNTTSLLVGSATILNGSWLSTVSPTSNGTVTVNSTGIYTHSIDGGSVPSATWNSGSLLRINSFVSSTTLGGMNQTFHHIEYDCPSQINPLQLSGAINAINGNFTMISSGSSQLRFFANSGNTNSTLTIAGNLIMTGGRIGVTNSGTSGPATIVLNVNGITNLSGSSSFDLTGSDFSTATSSTVNLNGDLTISGTARIIKSQSTSSIFRFNKSSGVQTYTASSPSTAISANIIDWEIGNGTTNPELVLANSFIMKSSSSSLTVRTGATLNCGATSVVSQDATGSFFTLQSGATLKTANVDGIEANVAVQSGSIRTNAAGGRNFNTNANYVYTGTANQITGTGLPTTHTGTLQIAASANVTLTNPGSTGSTLLLTSGTFVIGSGITYNISNGGTVTGSGGDFATGITGGTLNFPGSGTFIGNTNPYSVTASGAVNFGTTTTIQNGGTFRINAGGSANTNAPAYAVGSTLEYNTGGNYDRGLEWSTASGKGFPHHVAINTSTLNPARAGASFAATTFNTGGNLNVTSGGNIYMDFGGNNMTVPLIINGNLTLVGQLSGSGSAGGDIRIRGNWINDGVATNNYFPNSRAVFFDGTAAQTIGGTNTGANPFAFVIVDNTSGVTLLRSQTINNQLTHTNGLLSIGNFDLTMSPGSTITGASSTRYTNTNGTGRLIQEVVNGGGDKVYPIGTATSYAPVTLNQGSTTDNIGVRVKTAPAFLPVVNDNSQMVNFSYNLNEGTPGGNILTTRFQWNGSDEASGFIRGNTVYHGDHDGSIWQIRAASATAGANPYTSTAGGFTGNLSNREFVVGNLNGIRGCFTTIAGGDWVNDEFTVWGPSGRPPAGSIICLNHNVTVTSTDPNNMLALTFNPSSSLTVSSGRTLSLLASGTIANNSGSIQNLGNGTVVFAGAASIGGTQAVTFNNLTVNGATTINTIPTINGTVQLNSGAFINSNSLVYGAASTLVYATSGSYNVSNEWTGNSITAGLGVPANVRILAGTTLNLPTTNRGIASGIQIVNGSLNLNPTSGDLYIGGDWVRLASGVFSPNNRAVFFNGTGAQTISSASLAESFPYLIINKPSGTLTLTADVDITSNTGNGFQLSNGGSFDLNARTLSFATSGGNINANGGVASITGLGTIAVSNGIKTITQSGGGTFSFGPNVTIALSSGLNFGISLSTVNGTLQIANGGFVSTNPPTYSNTSTLRYFSGTTYGRGTEWSTITGPGYPNNVTIDFNGAPTTLDLGNGGSAIRQIAGNLTVNDGGILSMNITPMTNYLRVLGNVTIGSGTSGSLILSSSVGGDLQVGGNLTRNTSATFTQNTREVTMNGTAIQDINNVTSFNFLKIDNTGSSVRLNANINVVNRLWLNNGTLNLNGNSVNIANASKIRRSQTSATMSAAPTIAVSEVVDMEYNGTLTTGNEFINVLDKIRDVEITTGTLTLGGDKTVNRNLILSGGNLDLATFTFTHRGRATAPAFSGSITVSGGGTRLITGSVGCRYDVTGLLGNVPNDYTKTVSAFGGTLLNFDANVLLGVGDGSIDFGAGNPTTVNGTLQILLGGSVGQILNPCHYGTNSTLRFANNVDYIVGLNDKTWASGLINSGSPGIPFNVEILDANTDLRLEDTRSLRGSLTITNGSFSLNYVGVGTFSLGGNWTRTGASSAFNDPTFKKIIFDRQAEGDQSITTGSFVTAETFYDLEISPSLGNVIATIGTAINVRNNLNFASGKFILSGTNLITLGTASSNGSITGVTSSNYLVTYSGPNTSTLKRFTNTNAVYNFPVGDATNYSPIDLTLYSGANSGSFITGSVTATAHPQIGTSTNYLNRYWSMEQTGLSAGFGYGVDFSYNDSPFPLGDISGSEALIFPYKWTSNGVTPGTGWIGAGGSNASFQMGTGSVNMGANTMHWEGIYSFSDITGNGGGTPLPISLINFDAKKNDNTTDLSWSTLSETNNDFFTVERTTDGVSFIEIDKVDGAGNHNGILNYSTVDRNPANGKNYYRLKQTDFDGKFEYSKLVMVEFEGIKTQKSISVYPNPSNGNNVNVSISGVQNKASIFVRLSNSTGAEVYTTNVTAASGFANVQLQTSELANGIYYLQLIINGEITNQKVVVNNR